MIESNVIRPLRGFLCTILLYYLCESKGEGGDREHDLGGRDDDVAGHLPQHVKAVGLSDDDVHVDLFGEENIRIFFFVQSLNNFKLLLVKIQ